MESAATPARASHRLPALDGLRAVAVFEVMAGHAGLWARADLGVTLFFVLSGFLITRLLLAEYARSETINVWRFVGRRAGRIFPAYYAFLAVSFLADRLHGSPWPKDLAVAGVTYTMNYYNAIHGHPATTIAHAWSLAVEEQFYLLWPLTFLFLAHRRRLVEGMIVVTGAVLLWRTVALVTLHATSSYLYNAFEARCDALAIGCLLAACTVRASRGFTAWQTRLTAKAWYPFVTVVVLTATDLLLPGWYRYTVGFTVDALLCALLLVQCMASSTSPAWSWLNHPVFVFLGTISYPMYLYHEWGASAGHHALPAAPFVAGTLATVVLASGSYFVIEKPFLALRSRLLPAPTPP